MAHCHGHYKWGTFGRMTTDTWIDHMNDYDHNVHDLEDEDSDVESATSEKDPRTPSLGETGSGNGFLNFFYKTTVTLFRS